MLTILTPRLDSTMPCPHVSSSVSAGFPSPAEDHVNAVLDLNEHLLPHPMYSFFVKVTGNSMEGAGISDGDLLVVDRSLEAHDGQIVVASVDGDFTVKRLALGNNAVRLEAENPAYSPLELRSYQEFEVWGVVTHVIHALK